MRLILAPLSAGHNLNTMIYQVDVTVEKRPAFCDFCKQWKECFNARTGDTNDRDICDDCVKALWNLITNGDELKK